MERNLTNRNKTKPNAIWSSQVVAWKAVGNASEIAMIKFCQPFRDVDEYREANPNVFKIPFNSKNKYQVRRAVWRTAEAVLGSMGRSR